MPRVAFIHDWLTGMRGGEKCLERFIKLFPDCEIYTLFHKLGSTSNIIESRPIHTSRLQSLPGWQQYYRYLLPLFPFAAQWQMSNCDLVISLSHCVAKSAIAPPGLPHVSYCFTPMRYAWHMKEQYFRESFSPKAWLRDRILARLREWDRRTSNRVDEFIAISDTVAGRIRDCYGRNSRVIFPPVDTDFYQPANQKREDYYLVVSALAPYKRVDLAIDACRRLGRKLVIIGTGQVERDLRSHDRGDVQWLGWQPNEAIRAHMQKCRALIFPGEEDFGIVPVEAQACGTPVIAFGRGGAIETVIGLGAAQDPTGVFFHNQSAEALAESILAFDRQLGDFAPTTCRANALRFSTDQFDDKVRAYFKSFLNTNVSTAQQAA